MEMLGKELLCPDESFDDDDNISVESFPELPNTEELSEFFVHRVKIENNSCICLYLWKMRSKIFLMKVVSPYQIMSFEIFKTIMFWALNLSVGDLKCRVFLSNLMKVK